MERKLLAGFLSLCLLTEMLPISAFADAASTSCLHEHVDDCYQQVLDCSHEHTADCYPAENIGEDGMEQSPEDTARSEGEPSTCSHEHTDDCYRQELACTHEHTPDCFPAGEGDSTPAPEPDTPAVDGPEPTPPEEPGPETPENPDIPEPPETPGTPETPAEPTPPPAGAQNTAVHEHTPDCYQQVTACLHVHTPECYPAAPEPQPAAEEAEGTTPPAEPEAAPTEADEPQPTQCAHACTLENGCITTVLSCPYADAIILSGWSWIDEEQLLIPQGGQWYLSLPGASEAQPVEREELTTLLPTQLTATLPDGSEEALELKWNLTALPKDGAWEGSYILPAALPEGYILAEGLPQPQVTLLLGGAEVQAANYPAREFTLFANEAELNAALDDHKVQGLNPPDTTVNLFDYASTFDPKNAYTDGRSIDLLPRTRIIPEGENSTAAVEQDWNNGINHNRLLLFGDMMIGAGYWNIGAGAGRDWAKRNVNMQGIVKNLLVDGFPVLNLKNARNALPDVQNDNELVNIWRAEDDWNTDKSATVYALSKSILENAGAAYDEWDNDDSWNLTGIDPSLDYLFDSTEPPGHTDPIYGWRKPKRVYENITGLFQINDEGYYYYNARENFAEFVNDPTNTTRDGQPSAGYFTLYDGPAVWRTDGGWNADTNSFDGEKSLGNFFPFNTAAEVFDGLEKNANGEVLSSSEALDNAKWSTAVAYNQRTPLENQATQEDVLINHHMGMTVKIDFTQPVDGKLNMGAAGKQPMIFEFSGDDDVWIFIDDVLVLDIGGIHSELYGTIDFSTGDVVVGQSWRTGGEIPEDPTKDPAPTIKTTIRDQFIKAYGADAVKNMAWNGNTFASSSTHTLKMFYLERGNYDSSLYLRFNLQQQLYHQIKKVNQNGDPLSDVEFNLYAAKLKDGITEPSSDAADYEVVDGTILATLTTKDDGTDTFIEEDGHGGFRPFNFADRYAVDQTEYYILRESNPPNGYRKLPQDIILRFDPTTIMLVVANRYQTGAYASFVSNIVEGGQLTYGAFDTASGEILPSERKLGAENERDGLVIAVPMQLQRNMALAETTGKWGALYGNNLEGFGIVVPETRTAAAWRDAILKAALYQCSNEEWASWYVDYNVDSHRLEGTLQDLPGRADRYELSGTPNTDMKMTYGIIEPYALEAIGINEPTSAARYDALEAYVQQEIAAALAASPGRPREEVVEETISRISQKLRTTPSPGQTYDEDGEPIRRGFSFLNTDQFQREFRSVIYIPNEQRELQVWKVDEDGVSVNGATFALYEAALGADGKLIMGAKAAEGTTARVDGQDGVLIFTPSPKTDDGTPTGNPLPGYALMTWIDPTGADASPYYILQEISAPPGYTRNDTQIPIVLGHYSLYADAGTPDNGVTVMAGVGKLLQTMVQYAADDQVNITLRDITAIAQVQPDLASWDANGWEDDLLDGTGDLKIPRSMNLHYGVNALVDYGLHDEDGGKTMYPFFTTDTGFLRTRIVQNADALKNLQYEGFHNVANWDDLGDTDITGLFCQINIIVVTDKNNPEHHNGKLSISKRITGDDLIKEDYTRNFTFTVSLKDQAGAALPGRYHFYGSNRSGTVADGETLTLRHDESITILGLPPTARWSVTETIPEGWVAEPESGSFDGSVTADKTELAGFINTKKGPDGNLTVHKIVTGNRGDTSRSFPFKVTLDDATIQGKYGEMEFIDGVAQFQLHHDESKTALGLPAGVRYTVEETDSAGHTVTSTGETGTIPENRTATATFKNYRGGGGGNNEEEDYTSLTVKKVWKIGNGGTPADSIRVQLLRDGRHYATVTLSEENNWTYTWSRLDDWYHWTVAEVEVPEGFTSHITSNGRIWTITNSDSPERENPKTPGDPGNPDTSDLSQTWLWMSLCLYSLGGGGLLLYLNPEFVKKYLK